MIPLRLMAAVLGLMEAMTAASQRPAGCLAVHGESILAGDLAVTNPIFAALDPQLAIGPSPMAGARRDYSRLELTSLARRHGLTPTAMREVCFEWPSETLAPGALAATMGRVLDCDAGAVEIVEQSRFPSPPGELVFSREDLVPVPGSNGRLQLWRGFVRYGAGRRFPVWARVRIALPAIRIIALATLLPGQPILEHQLEQRTVTDASVDGVFASKLSDAEGRVPVVRIEPGTPIRIADLKVKPDIAAGEEVQVEVRNGPLRIYVTARAEQSGRRGETIPLTNVQSSAHFRARVEGTNKVSLTVQSRGER